MGRVRPETRVSLRRLAGHVGPGDRFAEFTGLYRYSLAWLPTLKTITKQLDWRLDMKKRENDALFSKLVIRATPSRASGFGPTHMDLAHTSSLIVESKKGGSPPLFALRFRCLREFGTMHR
jgi:hypothetical protein